jgi:choline-glycine betaine transporter
MSQTHTARLRPFVFFAPFLLLAASAAYSLYDAEGFMHRAEGLNNWILRHFGWLFSAGTLLFVGLCIAAYVSPLGRVRIGGPEARPILSRWQWFSVVLCTTIAIGILFWGAAEPLYHLHNPPAGLGAAPGGDAAARFALSTMFMHWTFTPYSIYTLAGLTFALAYYNLRQPYSLGAMLYPLLGQKAGRWAPAIDAVCLYSLAAGMAASLGAGALTIAGGLEKYAQLENTPLLLGAATLLVVVAYVGSSVTGLTRGIQWLSNLNTWVFLGLAGFVLLFGPTLKLLALGAEGLADYLWHFLPRSLGIGMEKDWADNWTVFYWANWLAWTPVTAVFLGQIATGYTVREFIRFNLLLPSLFSMLWMTIFSGNALYIDHYAGAADLHGMLLASGPESVIYGLFDQLPLPTLLGIVFFVTAFLSYVAGADANTSAMSGLSAGGISPETPEAPAWIKVAWGLVVGFMAWVVVAFAGIDGIKMASNLGGFPALFLLLAVAAAMVRLMLRWREL